MLELPFAWWSLSVRTAQMLAEAQTVIAFRLMGMAGGWPVTSSESRRMVLEKGPAFVRAGGAAMQAAMKGRRPDQVLGAALSPIGRKTRSNARRLSRRRR
jgi:hypothetical protein